MFPRLLSRSSPPAKEKAPLGHFSLLVAGTGLEPMPRGYEPLEVPLLHPAMFSNVNPAFQREMINFYNSKIYVFSKSQFSLAKESSSWIIKRLVGVAQPVVAPHS